MDTYNSVILQNLESNAMMRLKEAEMFTKRFGTFSKSDYEVLMFTIFQDSLAHSVRDYDISIALGITESKVRNLRIKSQLLYPKKLEWTGELAKSIERGYYDKTRKQITITFENPSVQSFVKNLVEKQCGVVWQSLNAKQLILPIESFLLLAAFAEKDEEEVLNSIRKALQKETKKTTVIEKQKFKERFLQNIPDVASFIASLVSIYNAGQPIIQSLLLKIA